MSEKLLIETSPIETRMARLSEGRLEAFHIVPAGAALLPGTPVAGRIRSIVPALEAAFVDIGLGEDAFLPLPKARLEAHAEGDLVLAGLVHLGVRDKGARLSREVSLPGRGLVLLVGGSGVHYSRQLEKDAKERLAVLVAGYELDRTRFGLIVRTEAAMLDDEAMTREFGSLMGEAQEIIANHEAAPGPGSLLNCDEALALFLRGLSLVETEILVDSGALSARLETHLRDARPDLATALDIHATRTLMEEAGVDEAIEKLLEGRIALPSGGEIVVETTEALTAIDVNTGEISRRKGMSGNKVSRALATNLEAADEISRILRAVNIGGLIAIDFLKMAGRGDETRVFERLQQGIAGDASPVRLGGFSKLGLFDLSRARRGPSLYDQLVDKRTGVRLGDDALAARAVRLALREAEAQPGQMIRCEISAEVHDRLEALRAGAKGDMMGALESRVNFLLQPDFARDRIEIRAEP